jgi:hypothetical protein
MVIRADARAEEQQPGYAFFETDWFTEEPGRFGAFGNGCGKARPE